MDEDSTACTRVVVDVDEADDDNEVFCNGARSPSPASPPPLSMLRSRRGSIQCQMESDPGGSDLQTNVADLPPAASFAKLVRTVQFIKKWARRAEREPNSARDEFLERFKMNGPNIDSAFARSLTEEEEEEDDDGGRRECALFKFIKRRRHLIFIWNPSGHWLYRCGPFEYNCLKKIM